MPRDTTLSTVRLRQDARWRALFRQIRDRVPLHDDLTAEITGRRTGPEDTTKAKPDVQQHAERWSMMTDQELKYVAEKWVAEYGDRAPSQIRQWAKDQDLETDAPVFFERVASLAERMLADQDGKSRRAN